MIDYSKNMSSVLFELNKSDQLLQYPETSEHLTNLVLDQLEESFRLSSSFCKDWHSKVWTLYSESKSLLFIVENALLNESNFIIGIKDNFESSIDFNFEVEKEIIISNQKVLFFQNKEINTINNYPNNKSGIFTFTSGSSNQPKIRTFDVDMLDRTVDAIVKYIPKILRANSVLNWLPLSALYQRVFNRLAWNLNKNIVSIYKNPINSLNSVYKYDTNFLFGVPIIFENLKSMIIEYSDKFGISTKQASRKILGDSFEFIITGSANLNNSTKKFFSSIDIEVFEAYGMTECIMPISIGLYGTKPDNAIGKKLSENKLRTDQNNQLSIASDFLAYEVQVDLDSNQSFLSEDLVQIDENDFVYLDGRCSEVIKLTNGTKISLSQLDSSYKDLGIEGTCVVLQKADGSLALVNYNQNSQPKFEKEISANLNKKLSSMPLSMRVETLYVIPRNPSEELGEITRTGKFVRRQILVQLNQHTEFKLNEKIR